MDKIGKTSFWLSMVTFLAAVIILFLLPPVFNIHLLPADVVIYGVFILEGLALILGVIAYKTKWGKYGATISFFIIVGLALHLYFQKPASP